MRFMKLVLAAVIAFGTMSVAAAPGVAQERHSAQRNYDLNRHDGRQDAGRDDKRRDRRWHNNRGRHRGWRNNPGRHRGWYNRRVCRTVWRHQQRQRVCRTVRYRR